MIFKELRIKNLFSYHDENSFVFPDPEEGKNIVLISGRNGFGKTSFINSLKLFFLGSTNEEVLRSVQRGRKLTEKNYLLGTGTEWRGVLNRAARSDGEKEYSISLIWEEKEGPVEATRSWTINGNDSIQQDLTIIPSFGVAPKDMEEAEVFLNERLPKDLVPFFFYDGEQVQTLAEANREKQLKQIERLFGLNTIDTIDEFIKINIKSWRRKGSENEAHYELVKFEKQYAEIKARIVRDQERANSYSIDKDELEEKIEADKRYLENLQAFAHQHETGLLKRDLLGAETNLQSSFDKVMELLPAEVPLLASVNLIEETIQDLSELISSDNVVLSSKLTEIIDDLPRDLFGKGLPSTPPLSADQQQFYTDKLISLLKPYVSDPSQVANVVIKIEPSRAKRLLNFLEFYKAATSIRVQCVKELKKVTENINKVSELKDQIDDVSNLSEDERQRYEERKALRDQRVEAVREIVKNIDELNKEIFHVSKLLDKQRDEVKRQRKELKIAGEAKEKVDLSNKLTKLFSAYRKGLKVGLKDDVEESMNRLFKKLMTSHTQIHSIKVGEDFDLHYLDVNGEPLSMAGFSAGMKQLIATALLWTLKELSNRPVPVVIDTPLARIDRSHQENLLRNYYPNAGQQVIVLPTDSELDKEKYETLKPFIVGEFKLSNKDGEHTSVTIAPMYS